MNVRPATPDDIGEVLRLAAIMYRSMGQAPGADWERGATRAMTERLGGETMAIFVTDAPEPGRLASCVAGTLGERLPGPLSPERNLTGYVQWMCTDPGYRRRGLARGVLSALLEWFWSRGVTMVELHATVDGEPLYASLGFRAPSTPQMRLPLLSGEPPGR